MVERGPVRPPESQAGSSESRPSEAGGSAAQGEAAEADGRLIPAEHGGRVKHVQSQVKEVSPECVNTHFWSCYPQRDRQWRDDVNAAACESHAIVGLSTVYFVRDKVAIHTFG